MNIFIIPPWLTVSCSGTDTCPVDVYRVYASRRPESCCQPDSRFYLKPMKELKSEVWFCHTPLGKNSIGNIAKKMTERAGIHEKKTNHSGRKTAIQTLLHAAVPPTAVMQLSGHKNVQSLNSYAHLSHEQQRTMSQILSGKSKQISAFTACTVVLCKLL
jgi:hypothetical protein